MRIWCRLSKMKKKFSKKPSFLAAKLQNDILRPMMNGKLDEEEKEILESYENDEWVSISNPEDISRYQAAAKTTFEKNVRVDIRSSGMNLELIQERALMEGIPYQALMSSVLHKCVNGRLIDKNA